MKSVMAFAVLLPRNLVVLILRLYRVVISPIYGDVCRYYPSCSSYALQAIQRFGVVRGSWMGTRRIARCHPWAAGGVDDVPPRPESNNGRKYAVTRLGFVVSMATER